MPSPKRETRHDIRSPRGLSERITFLRDYYFSGLKRSWNNEYTSWTTGTDWDIQLNELPYYIAPESHMAIQTMKSSFRMTARRVRLHDDFWSWSLPERRAWFVKEVMVNYLPQEILPGDLLAGGRFNVHTSLCLTEKEAREYNRLVLGKKGCRSQLMWFHSHGYGNAGATSGHVIPGHERALKIGWKGIYAELESIYERLDKRERLGPKGAQLRAMMTAATMPREVAGRYAALCRSLSERETDAARKDELLRMAENLDRVPWEPAETFWEAVQALWLNHMLVMADENYPGSGTSFGRIDQYLLPYWEHSSADRTDREFAKEILKCLWIHCNTAYDGMIRTGNQGITGTLGQLMTLSGMGKGGRDRTNDLTYAILEVVDEMSPILEPKPNIRLHRGSPDRLLDKIVDMIGTNQGSPFLLNFDERSIAGMMREAREAGLTHLINEDTVHDYAVVGCVENTMAGNDRSGTVDCNINLVKAVELALTGGNGMLPVLDPLTGKTEKARREGPNTGDAALFSTWDEFWRAYEAQTRYLIRRVVELYEASESVRARYFQTPLLSCMIGGCAEAARDVTQGGAQIGMVTVEGVTFATTVDSLLAVKYLVFDRKECSIEELVRALRANWAGYEVLQSKARSRAPKYGRDDDKADEMAAAVMRLWADETWNYRTKSTGRQFRPGMHSGSYWMTDSVILPASPDGRAQGQPFSNAICPTTGADTNGPTANANSVGKSLGGTSPGAAGDWMGYVNVLPNGASHTITMNPSLFKDDGHRDKLKAFLRGLIENGGSAVQINVVDADMLRAAQKNPGNYRHLLVRITGYNSYFVSVGRGLQDEIIARMSHANL
jgi:pyruvate-formate lyase